ncbi:hypothetical protein TWF569_006246 [Orbilia oligospora]|uniref:Uncharacterized protein n=1 Tax=Orbilia oligospora TaxID=2813651 RepID=A0A7C8JH57_ORBOL|nr:hypothetical protein TWF706_004615 [Orbilia oligospora]KAF3113500.1 hypothetical protein TWF102_000159 [Orbilia oligospora]KAF3146782.1 hypothetical protein TWF569_006246 [Orbilia oligospora]
MKAFNTLAVVAAFICPVFTTPVAVDGAAVLEPRTNYEFYSWASLGCPGAANVKRFTQNKCVALPGVSTKLATPDGSCTTHLALDLASYQRTMYATIPETTTQLELTVKPFGCFMASLLKGFVEMLVHCL